MKNTKKILPLLLALLPLVSGCDAFAESNDDRYAPENQERKESVLDGKTFYPPLLTIAMADKSLVESLLEERKNGPFLSFYDFAKRMVGKITLEQEKSLLRLIDAGAFDSLSRSRTKMKEKLSDYLAFARLSFPENQVPSLVGEEDVGKRLYLEKQSLGVILSTSLKDIVKRKGYKTLLVLDDSRLENDHYLLATDGRKDYTIHTAVRDIHNNDFVLVQGDFTRKVLYQCDLINTKGRKEHYE